MDLVGVNGTLALSLVGTGGGAGTYILGNGTANSATLITGNIGSSGAGTGTFLAAGGVIKPTGSSSNFFGNVTNAYISAGGLTFNTGGDNLTITQNFTTDPGLGGAADSGITYTGGGIVSIAPASTAISSYKGNTTITNTTLILGSAGFQNSTLTGGNVVVTNATLDSWSNNLNRSLVINNAGTVLAESGSSFGGVNITVNSGAKFVGLGQTNINSTISVLANGTFQPGTAAINGSSL